MPRKKIEKLPEQPKEKMVSIYDPTVNAFREVSLSLAVKFIEEAEKLKEQLLASGDIEIEE